jgi:hypothetical protein
MPVKHPLFNIREVCKQCVLLEDHLNCPGKRCPDCIRKHFLTIEALFEEASSLDTGREWDGLIDGKADTIRDLEAKWIDGGDPRGLARVIRAIRKALSPRCFDLRPMGKAAGAVSPMARFIAEAHTLRTADAHGTFDVFLHKLAGKFAEWAVRQSPYDVPDGLESAIDKLVFWFRPRTNKRTIGEFEILSTTSHELEQDILAAFHAIPEVLAWNERKNGNDSPLQFVSMYDGAPDPDNDFIDIQALARNVAHDLWAESVLGNLDLSLFTAARTVNGELPARTASGNPIKALRSFLVVLYKRVMDDVDIDTPDNQKVLAALMKAADEALVGHPHLGRSPYEDYARSVLRFNPVVMHLGDGGYSRLTVSVMDPPHLWGHSSNQETVNRNWQALKG